jgi:sterol desaturase/sphingolipid hydroxylase (fatty acid hydroxylase superfamily)
MSIVIAIVLHDTYFYWIHRFMHQRRIYRWFHRVHHLSANPSPWAAYAFSPLEALAHAGIAPIIFWLIPIHPFAFVIFMVFGLTWNIVVGHTGFEFFPRWWLNSWLGKCFITPTHHIMHHESFAGNYGHYFVFWDRLMGTGHQEYQKRFHEVVGRESQQPDTVKQNAPPIPTVNELQ